MADTKRSKSNNNLNVPAIKIMDGKSLGSNANPSIDDNLEDSNLTIPKIATLKS